MTRALTILTMLLVTSGACTSTVETTPNMTDDADSDSDADGAGGDADGTVDDNDAPTGLVRVENTSCQLGSAAPPDPSAATFSSADAFASVSLGALTGLVPIPDGSGRLAAVEQSGLVTAFDPSAATPTGTSYLDIETRVAFSSEQGLHSIAFHPSFAQNGYLFVMYTDQATGDSNVARFTRSSTDTSVMNPNTELIILTIDRPNTNHNGGQIFFGSDGYLYVSMGDSGSGGDPLEYAQNTNVLQGKLLRLDVDLPSGGNNYGIPPTNPFAGQSGKRQEIYAYGLRNPWRVSQDPVTGLIWCADVGQNAWEEIDLIQNGGNYGWDNVEGNSCYEPSSGCNRTGLIDPVHVYDHSGGRCSITGGFVYRGSANAELVGKYLFADYCSGEVWALEPSTGAVTFLFNEGFGVQSFGLDAAGEIYLLKSDGSIKAIVRDGGPSTSDFPMTLSQTGCYSDLATRTLAAGIVPYDVVVPFWSDGASKRRYFKLPPNSTITFSPDGAYTFPVGTIFIKELELELTTGQPTSVHPLETRFMIQRTAGVWESYTYKWNDDATEATLLHEATRATYAVTTNGTTVNREHYFPSRPECTRCHNAAGGRTLGLFTNQLNRDVDYGAGPVNQLLALERAGYFAGALPATPQSLARLPSINDPSQPLEMRARAYLHTNCSYCHRSGGELASPNYRFDTPLASSGICGVITPGNAGTSRLIQRAGIRGASQMPPLATLRVDTEGIALLSDWIESLSSCP